MARPALALVALVALVAITCHNAAAVPRDSMPTVDASRGSSRSDSTPGASTDSTSERTWIEMRNVDLRVLERAVVGVRRLHGEVISTHSGVAPILDSTSSFTIRITSGTVAIKSADLATLMNDFVFAYKGSPLHDLKVRTKGN